MSTSMLHLVGSAIRTTVLAEADLFVDPTGATSAKGSVEARIQGTALEHFPVVALQAGVFNDILHPRGAGGKFAKKWGALEDATDKGADVIDEAISGKPTTVLGRLGISPRTGKSVAAGACSHSLDCFDDKMKANMLADLKSTTVGFDKTKNVDDAVKALEANYDAVFKEAVLDHGGNFPPVSPEDFPRSGNWYPAASRNTTELGHSLGIADPDRAAAVGAGVAAVYSPKTEWGLNVTQAHATADLWRRNHIATAEDLTASHKDFVYLANKTRNTRPDSQALLDRYDGKPELFAADFTGKSVRELHPMVAAAAMQGHWKLNPQVVTDMTLDGDLVSRGGPRKITPDLANATKALRIIQSGVNDDDDAFKAVLDQNMGGQSKVRSFFSNIYHPDDPRGPVTVDTHMTAAGIGQPVGADHPSVDKAVFTNREGGFGMGRTYPLHEAAVRNLANKYGVPPRQMQSMIWQRQVDAYGGRGKPTVFKEHGPLIERIARERGAAAAGEATRRIFPLVEARANTSGDGRRKAQEAIDSAVADLEKTLKPKRSRKTV